MLPPLATLYALLSLSLAFPTSPSGNAFDTDIVKNYFIVRFDTSHLSHSKRDTIHFDFSADLRKQNLVHDVTHSWSWTPSSTSLDFYASAISLSTADDLGKIYAMDNILSVFPVRRYISPKPLTQALPSAAEFPLDTFSSHVMTGVDKLHEQGFYGKGMLVGIVDSGIDYTHPALGGCFGGRCKVSKGYDFSGDTFDGYNIATATPDSNPYSNGTCGPHGTHVAGIVAANSTTPLFTGVVPQANIAMYRVFGCEDPVTEEAYTQDPLIIDGLIRAYNDGCDVVSLSLGGPVGSSESPASVVASMIADAGRVVSIAAGNEGSAGTFYASSPAGGLSQVSVASVDVANNTVYQATLNGPETATNFFYFADRPFNITNLPIYALSNDTSTTNAGDACSTLPSSTPDLSAHIVLVKRGTCAFVQKFANVAAAGGKYLFVYNQPDTSLQGVPSPLPYGLLGAGMITYSDGVALVAAAQTATVSANDFTVYGSPNPTGGKISYYSTYGPNYQLDTLYPSLAAPGGNILSTLPLDIGGYGIYSGTSMATPFFSGAAALFLSIRGKTSVTANQLRDIFITTSAPILNQTGTPYESVIHQGGGLINVTKAVATPLLISPSYLLLNDTQYLNAVHTITVINTGSSPIVVPVSHLPAGTTETFIPGTIIHNPWPVPLVDRPARMALSSTRLVTPARGSARVVVTVTPPRGYSSIASIYSGYIKFGDELTVPYYGLAGRMSDLPILDTTDQIFGFTLPGLLDASENPIPSTSNVSLSISAGDTVIPIFRLVVGSQSVHLDMVEANVTLPASALTHAPVSNLKSKRSSPYRLKDSLEKKSGGLLDIGADIGTVAGAVSGVVGAAVGAVGQTVGGIEAVVQVGVSPLPWIHLNATVGIGHTAPDNSFSSVPIVGSIDFGAFLPRNDEWSGDYYSDPFNGTLWAPNDFSRSITLPPGDYKVLLRVQKLVGDANSESSYEAWLSQTITLVP